MPPRKKKTSSKKAPAKRKASERKSRSRSRSQSRSRSRSSSGSSSRAKPAKKAKTTTSKAKIPDLSAINFSSSAVSPSGKKWNLKISSWNVNGLRAWLEKNGQSFIDYEKPDIFCVQETKCSEDKVPKEMKNVDGYHCYWLSGDKEGYSGVGLMSKIKPESIKYGIGHKEHDNEGRVITAEYSKFYLVNAYVPNAGRGLVRLDYRMKWDEDFRKYLKKLDSKKHVILCGDLNVAHEEIDLANPKTNKRNAGFTQEERDGFSELLEEGFVDSFRHLHPDEKGAYTFWTYMMNARARNVGWRLDYFVISKKAVSHLCESLIRSSVHGSDHCPVTLLMAF